MLMHSCLKGIITDEEEKLFKIVSYSSNQILFNEGDHCQSVGFILEGNIVISTISYSGKEEFFNNMKQNDVFGNVLIFSSNDIYLGDVIAKTNAKVAYISKDNLLKLFSIDNKFLNMYLSLICNETLESKKEKKLLLQKKISDRILFYINLEGGSLKIKSIADLARKLSYPRPSISRTINSMIDKGIIEYTSAREIKIRK